MKEIKYKVVNAESAQNVLLGCGIYPSKNGFNYLLAAIQIFRGPTNSLCEIYKKVGTMFKVSAGSVERSIRTCLTEAFYINSFVFLNRFFKMDIFTRETYLVNGDFISIVSTYLDVIDAPDIEFIIINDPKE